MTSAPTKTPFKRFLNTGHIEGISYLVLLFVAIPLKKYANMPEAVRVVGMIHGLLFILYVILLAYCTNYYGWKIKTVILSFVLSLIPFGTFFLEKTVRNADK
jgi:integral membrane protein